MSPGSTRTADTPRSRLQFVRRRGRARSSRVAYVVRSEEGVSDVRRFQLDDLEALSSVDLASGGEPVETSLVLVCAHGSRDRGVCARDPAKLLDERVERGRVHRVIHLTAGERRVIVPFGASTSASMPIGTVHCGV